MEGSFSSIYTVGNIVWAALGRYPPWPSKICVPNDSYKAPNSNDKKYIWVYFFGSRNYAWVPECQIWPYEEFKSRFTIKPTNSLIKAVEKADSILEKRRNRSNTTDQEKDDSESEQFRLRHNKKPKRKKKSQKNCSVSKKSRTSSAPKKDPIVMCRRLPDMILRAETVAVENPLNIPIGIIGMGQLGSEVTGHLLNAGCNVTIWNRTMSKCEQFSEGANPAKLATHPSELVNCCDIIFLCVATSFVKPLFLNYIVKCSLLGKNLVILSSINPETSLDIEELVVKGGGWYLESPATRCREIEKDNRHLMVFCAGSKSLFDACCFYFNIMARHAFYYRQLGAPSMLNLILSALQCSIVAGIVDALALSKKTMLAENRLVNAILCSNFNFKQCVDDATGIFHGCNPKNIKLKHLGQNLCNVVLLGFDSNYPVRVFGSALQFFTLLEHHIKNN